MVEKDVHSGAPYGSRNAEFPHGTRTCMSFGEFLECGQYLCGNCIIAKSYAHRRRANFALEMPFPLSIMGESDCLWPSRCYGKFRVVEEPTYASPSVACRWCHASRLGSSATMRDALGVQPPDGEVQRCGEAHPCQIGHQQNACDFSDPPERR